MSGFAIDLTPHIVSGTIDNSTKGTVSGHLVIQGLDEPVEINLIGNAQPDLAGCILKFQNPHPLPIDPETVEFLLPNQTGYAGLITAARKGEAFVDEQWTVACQLTVEWLNFSILTPFLIMGSQFKLDIDLPKWRMTDLEIDLQKKEIEAGRTVFLEMYKEFEEDCIESELNEERYQIIESIMPQLELAETDGERISLLREALGPGIDDYDLEGYLDVYFSPVDFPGDLPEAPVTPTITLDKELKALGNRINECTKLLLFHAEEGEPPVKLIEMGKQISHTMGLMLHSSTLLDPNPDAPQIEPFSTIRQLENSSAQTRSLISYLELEGTAEEKQYCEPAWILLKEIEKLTEMLREKTPDDFLPPQDFDDEDDIPF